MLQGGAAASLLRCALFCCVEVLQIVPLLMDIQVSLIWHGQYPPAGALAPQRWARPAQERRGRGGAACLLPPPRQPVCLPPEHKRQQWGTAPRPVSGGCVDSVSKCRHAAGPGPGAGGSLSPAGHLTANCSPAPRSPEPTERRPPYHVWLHQAPRCQAAPAVGCRESLRRRTPRLQHSKQAVPASEEHSPEPFPGHWELEHGFQSPAARSPLGRFGHNR